ncbi:DDE-type integrase/transposase/recombinase [Corynebacterium belfantii]|uniref:DDE-type integrase/transposase/recombinase n=1 Tax=Corynebacterium belfantii TaxID=2014537 RepID=UPI000B4C01B8
MGHLSQLVNLRAWIFALTWSIVNLGLLAPNRLWVADITYVRTRTRLRVHRVPDRCVLLGGLSGGCCWIRCALQALLLQALNQAIVCAKEMTGLIHHSDHGWQYVSIVYNERLEEHGISASIGTVGDSYDNALAENVNGPLTRMR